MRKRYLSSWAGIFFAIALSFLPLYSQSLMTGAIEGKVTSDTGEGLPGAKVVLESDAIIQGQIETFTGKNGGFRFPALKPGTYSIKSSMEGFAPLEQKGIAVHLGKTVNVNLILQVGKLTVEVAVISRTPLIDLKDSATAVTELPSQLLQNIPNRQNWQDIVNLAPGVSNDSAYGAPIQTGISYQIDGVNVSDPGEGRKWVRLDYNSVQEVSVSGIGAPAEYGEYSGVIFNTVTKSGTNKVEGYGELLLQSKGWTSSHESAAQAGLTYQNRSEVGASFNLGGPIVKDRLTFFLSAAYSNVQSFYDVSEEGYVDKSNWHAPKLFLKLSWQAAAGTRFQLFGQYDNSRSPGMYGGYGYIDAQAKYESPNLILNGDVLHTFSNKTFLEAKFAYYNGTATTTPTKGDEPGHVDAWNWIYIGNYIYRPHEKRDRFQGKASLSHHAEDFLAGSHDFKMGVEFQRGHYLYGDNTTAFYDYALGYDYQYTVVGYWGYEHEGTVNTISAFVQDNWTLGKRLTLNPGLRYTAYRGTVKTSDVVIKPKSNLAPRIGLTWDVLRNHSLALKAHWGRYYDQLYIRGFKGLSKNNLPSWGRYVLDPATYPAEGSYELWWYYPGGGTDTTLDPNIRQPYMDQWTVGVEYQILKDMSIGVSYIDRLRKDLQGQIPVNSVWIPVEIENPLGGTITVYQAGYALDQTQWLITNPDKDKYPGVVFIDPYQKYQGIEFTLNKRFSNNWMLMVSYVYGKSTGTVDNNSTRLAAGSEVNSGWAKFYHSPNTQINAEGHLTYDPTHMLKIQGNVILPLGINLTAYFSAISGNTWTNTYKPPKSIYMPSSANLNIRLEPRGSERYPAQYNLDIRLEKIFQIGDFRLGVYADMFNALNGDEPFSWITQVNVPTYLKITGIRDPRDYKFGLRFWF
jgi:outer membrane receptor protein involved in Fe transport